MRISDWSSDVCSSDLCAEVVERQGPRSRIDIGDGFLNLAVGEDRQDWSEDFLTHYRHVVCRIEYDRRGQRVGTRGRIFAVASHANNPSALGPCVIQQSGEASVMLLVDDGRVVSARRTVRDKRRNSLARSEEHTSELQSLMRNSYAVFCLK